MLATDIEIQTGYVYENDAGEQRLVVSVRPAGEQGDNAVAVWRTSNPDLGKGLKAQGSATLKSFKRWATKHRRATGHDWEAFQKVERRRVLDSELKRDILRAKKAIRREAKNP